MELNEKHAHPQEVHMDDEMMRLMDPRHTSKFDVDEGEAEWKKQEETLMSKLTKGHHRHPDYGRHADGRRDDCMWTDADRANDQLIMQVWEVLSTHREVFSRTPKTPDQTSTTEHAIILEGDVPTPHQCTGGPERTNTWWRNG